MLLDKENLSEQLSQLAKAKMAHKIEEIADEILSFECPEEYWATMDGIEVRAKGKEIWSFEFDEDLIAVFVGKTFEQVKSSVESLPDKLTEEKKKQVIEKVKALVPDTKFVYMLADSDEYCTAVVSKAPENKDKIIIDDVSVQYLIDSKNKYKIPKGAIK